MNRESLTDIVRKSVAEFVRGYDYDSTEVRELFNDGENLADQIVEDILRVNNPTPVSKPKPTRQATATTVSTCLGKYRDDEDGKPLGRAIVRQTRFGPVQYGGFKVSGAGNPPGTVTVRWVAPDSMTDEQEIATERMDMLLWYSDILARSGYNTAFVGTSLHVTR